MLPERNLTYSAWMSVKRLDGEAGRETAPRTAAVPSAQTVQPPNRLVPIRHPPDLPAHVVAHEQRAIRGGHDADRTAPARTIGSLPPHDEVLDADGAPVLDAHPHDLGARRHRAVPGSVIGDEHVTAAVPRALHPRVERHTDLRGVCLKRDGRRLDAGAVRGGVLGVADAGEIAVRPAVVAAVLHDVDALRRDVVPGVVAIVVR